MPPSSSDHPPRAPSIAMSGFVARSHGTVLTRYVEIGIAANTMPRR